MHPFIFYYPLFEYKEKGQYVDGLEDLVALCPMILYIVGTHRITHRRCSFLGLYDTILFHKT